MEGLLLILVPVGLLVAAVLVGLMFADVAFLGGDRRAEEREREIVRWRPPYIRGRELVAWARETAARIAKESLGRDGSPAAPDKVAATLQEGAIRAMLPGVSERELRRVLPCPASGQGSVGVTAAEAMALAERIRWSFPRDERERIRSRAEAIAADLAAGDGGNGNGIPRGCALQGPDHVCLTYEGRPLRCRPLHATLLLQRTDRRVDGRDPARQAVDPVRIADGIQEGWSTALEEAGLDPKVYELNSALAVALGSEDAYLRWLEGEPVFADCRLARA